MTKKQKKEESQALTTSPNNRIICRICGKEPGDAGCSHAPGNYVDVRTLNTQTNNQESTEALIARAIDKNVPVDVMERLLAMRLTLKQEYAKEAFNTAMSHFQAECPTIKKDKQVMNKDGRTVRYSYAPLDSIVNQIKDLIQKRGFSYSIDALVEDSWVTATCKITHELGHSETSRFKVPVDRSAYMNSPQQFASALTFAKRYAFCNAFGILTGDEDDDSRSVEAYKPATQAKPVAKKPLHPKIEIMNLLAKLGLDTKIEDKELLGDRCKAFVLSTTGLELVEKNYEEIIGRLSVRVQENEEAQSIQRLRREWRNGK